MNIFAWILAAPSLVGKLNRAIHSAKVKNWVTTVAVLVAIGIQVAGLLGFSTTPELANGIQSVALFIVGLFTGVRVVDPVHPTDERVIDGIQTK